jgi:hypothetical protein
MNFIDFMDFRLYSLSPLQTFYSFIQTSVAPEPYFDIGASK